MNNQTGQIDASSQEYQLKALEDGINRCDQNIQIFSQEVEKQRALKIELEIQYRELKVKLGKH